MKSDRHICQKAQAQYQLEPSYTKSDSARHNKWYFGPITTALAVVATHPLDTLKVLIQRQRGICSMRTLAGRAAKNNNDSK